MLAIFSRLGSPLPETPADWPPPSPAALKGDRPDAGGEA